MVFLRTNLSRRSFLKLGKAGIFSMPLWPFGIKSPFQSFRTNQSLPQIGLQLNTIRREIEKKPKDVFKQVSFIGFAGLETPHTFSGMTVEEYAKIIKKSGLKVISMHVELPLDTTSRESVLKRKKVFNCNRIVWHGLPESDLYRTEAGIEQLANRYNEANMFARSNGMIFGIQNHWWEFEPLEDGRLPFDILLEKLDPEIFLELDVYWVAVAGQSPEKIIQKLGKRVKFLHVKDGPAEWTPRLDDPIPYPVLAVGTGKMDYPSILDACKGIVEWIFVDIEECETDIIQAIYESYKFIALNGYGNGLK